LAQKLNKFLQRAKQCRNTRLCGGACSLLRTRLQANSLLTGKITGNTLDFDRFYEFAYGNPMVISTICIEIPYTCKQGIQMLDQGKEQDEQGFIAEPTYGTSGNV
jgi:hypothetical protein